jgi:hypothetical protein
VKFFNGFTGATSSQTLGLASPAPDECQDEVHSPPFVTEGTLYIRNMIHKEARVKHDFYVKKSYPTPDHYWGTSPMVPNGVQATWGIEWDFLLNDALASIQDTDPIVDVPVALAELGSLPASLMTLCKNLLDVSKVGDKFLAYQWAVAPTVSDILGLISLQKSIASRMASHRKKYRTKRSRGRLPKRTWMIPGQPVSTRPWRVGGSCSILQEYSETATCWYSARIVPKLTIPELMSEIAPVSAALGFRRRRALAVLYELMPWSWLIDYFSTLGQLVGAASNAMPYEVESICLMVTQKNVCKVTPQATLPSSTSLNHPRYLHNVVGHHGRVEKHRKLYNSPSGKFSVSPMLTAGQLANLLALSSSILGRRSKLRSL